MSNSHDASLGGERKLATMLFVDLSGFTELSLREDPEKVRVRIRPLLEGMVHIAELHGALVGNVEGDGFLALFGVPVSHDDDPQRAVRAADRMRRLSASRTDGLAVHMGLATGEVFAEVVRGSWSVNGAAVNLASRLCGLARGGETLVDESCAALAGDAVVWADRRVIEVKGHSEPVPVAVLDSIWDQVEPEVDPVLVTGRDAQVRVLDRVLEEVATTGRSQTVLVVGDPGVGKSALMASWGRGSGARWFYGRSRGAPFDVPFDPVSSALRSLPTMEDALQAVPVKQAEGLPISPWWEVVLDGTTTVGTYEGRDGVLAAGFRDALQQIAAHGPVVLCLDDIHLASTDVLQWLDELTDAPLAGPVLVIAGARVPPEELEVDHMIELQPLELEEMAELLASTVGPVIDLRTATLIHQRTGGNPLFAKECAGWLRDRGELGPGATGLAEAIRQVPDSVRLVLAARLDSLAPSTKRVLQAVSVWGDEGPTEALNHLARQEPEGIAALVSDDLFEVRAGRWRFAHSLVRDVAYSSLPKRDRALLHESVLEVAQVSQAQRAFHAAAVLDLDVAEDSVAGAFIARRAALETVRHVRGLFAVEARSARDAVERARSVIEAAESVAREDAAALLLLGSSAAAELGEFAAGAELARRARSIAELAHEPSLLPTAMIAEARCLSRLRELEPAAEMARAALGMLDSNNPEHQTLIGRAQMVIGETHRYESFSIWVAHLDQAYEAFTSGSDFDGAGEASRLAAYVLSTTAGDEPGRWLERATGLTENDDLRGRAWLARSRMLSSAARGMWVAAVAAAQNAADLADAAGLRDIRVEAEVVLAEAASRCGQHGASVRLREQWLAEGVDDDYELMELAVTTAIGMVRSGRVTEALESLASAEVLAAQFGETERLDLALCWAEVDLICGRFEPSVSRFTEALALARAKELTLSALAARVGIARASSCAGQNLPADELTVLADELGAAGSLGYLQVLHACFPAVFDTPAVDEALPSDPQARALALENNGEWVGAATAWAELGVSEDLARALERSGETQRAADVRAILRAD